MALIYISNDSIGSQSGGGRVTMEERDALREIGFVHTFQPRGDLHDPFAQDEDVCLQLKAAVSHTDPAPRLAHVYAGCFTRSVAYLKEIGYKVTYTVAAHDVDRSRQAHLDLGASFPYPHLNDPGMFRSYTSGYVSLADVVIVPGSCAERTVRKQGRTRRTVIIPHGCDIPTEDRPSVQAFVWRPETVWVGYLGAVGPDKGLLTLAKAWKHYTSNTTTSPVGLRLGGRYSLSAIPMFKSICGQTANVVATGWLDRVSDFYDRIELYVQPSNTEGFGIEVPEAMAHGVPVICSDQAGAADCVPESWRFVAGDYKQLAQRIGSAVRLVEDGMSPQWHHNWRDRAANYAWDKIRAQYVELWKGVLGV